MTSEHISVKGRQAIVHQNADRLSQRQLALFAQQISDSVSGSRFTKPLTPDEVTKLIISGMSLMLVDARDSDQLLAHTNIVPGTKRGKPVSFLGGWVSYANGFGLEVMRLAAIKAVTDHGTDAIAKVHVLNTPAKRAMQNIGARRTGIGISPATKNIVFTYNLTNVGRRKV
ncbi:MAG TPA: hypothetical protein VLF20_02480 [Patescibacteria group bacterium]|nr:hypothetical protein [Patescibacteria group bacterium]